MSAYDDAVRSRGMEEKVLKKACTFIACRLVFNFSSVCGSFNAGRI